MTEGIEKSARLTRTNCTHCLRVALSFGKAWTLCPVLLELLHPAQTQLYTILKLHLPTHLPNSLCYTYLPNSLCYAICLPVSLSLGLYLYRSIYLSISIYLYVYPSIYLGYLYMYLCIYLSLISLVLSTLNGSRRATSVVSLP